MSSYDWLEVFNVQPVLELLFSSLKIGYRPLQKHKPRTLVIGFIWMPVSKNVVGFAYFLFDCLMVDSDDIYPDTMSKI